MKRFLRLLVLCGFVSGASAVDAKLELGANFNEHLHVARLPALDATGVSWIRGFLPATEFLDGPRRLATDPGLATFRAAAATGRKLALTLKWDFLKSQTRVPAPDTAREQACFAWALEVARVGRPDLLLLVNELTIDTPDEDLRPGADGAIPMVRFLQRLAARVAAAKLTASGGTPLPVSCGGFTKLDTAEIQKHPATQALLPWLAATPHLTHVNFHMHQHTLAEFAAALDFLRAHCSGRPFVVTEFSLVWAYGKNVDETLGHHPAGRAFAAKFHRDPAQTVRAYLHAAAQKPVAEDELHALLASRAWFDPLFLEKSCRLMESRGVVLATYAYLQESSGLENPRAPVRVLWRLNPVFQERHAFAPAAETRPAINLGFHATFVEWQRARRR